MVKIRLKENRFNFNQGITLVEVLIALLILMGTILPVISAFSKYYGTSSKQLDQEIALKITEATMNKLLSAKFSSLNSSGSNIEFPLNFETPAGIFSGLFKFSGNDGYSNDIKLGANVYKITAKTSKLFIGQDPLAVPPPTALASGALVFRYAEDTSVKTYICTDDMISIQMNTKYGKNQTKTLQIITLRADMTQ